MRVLRREGHGARSPLFIGVHVLLACQAGAVITALQDAVWLYPVRLRRGWCRLAAGDIRSGCSEESPSDWSSRLAGLTRRLPLIDAGVGECGTAAPWCTDPASRSPQCFQGSHDRGPEFPQVSQAASAVHRVTGGVTNFCLVEEGDSSRLVDVGTRGEWGPAAAGLVRSGRRAGGRGAHDVHGDHTGFAERARTKASAWCGYTKPTPRWPRHQTRKADAASGGDKLGARHPHIAEANHDASNSTCGKPRPVRPALRQTARRPGVWVCCAQAAVASSRAMPAAQSSISGQSRKSPSGRAVRAAGSLRSDRSARVSFPGSSAPKKTW